MMQGFLSHQEGVMDTGEKMRWLRVIEEYSWLSWEGRDWEIC